MKPFFIVLLTVSAAVAETITSDVVVYGGTPAGVSAAIAAAKQGRDVALIDVNAHVGGMMSGGLVDTDIGDRSTVGGLADDFLKRVTEHYRKTYGEKSKQFERCRNGVKFEPHVAEKIFEEMLAEHPKIRVWRSHRHRSANLEGGKITSIAVDDVKGGDSRTFSGKIFIDASYEGDVMAGAMVPYRTGRESRAEFGETLAGINMGPKEIRGLGDHRTQAYNYRVSITSDKENRVMFPKPENYDPEPWRATYGQRVLKQGITTFAGLYVNAAGKEGPNAKFDTNWCDLRGGAEGYAEGDWETRDRIAAKHRDYFLSLLWYLQNDPELPQAFRDDAAKWGLPKDEFADSGHFPFQLYVREGRRMMGRYILRENDLTQNRYKPRGICAGSYGIDCHVVQLLLDGGAPVVERTRHVSVDNYDIPYDCITPHEPKNLLVPVCISATHVAYASLRMEPVYMMLGQAAGTAAHLALDGGTSVQDVDVEKLRGLLSKEGAILDAGYQPQVSIVADPPVAAKGEEVKFSISEGFLKSPIKRMWWDVTGDGSVASSERTFGHRFESGKIHTVSLLVEDEDGRRRLVSTEVPVAKPEHTDVTMDEFDAELTGAWKGAYPLMIRRPGERLPDVFIGPGSHRDTVRRGEKAAVAAEFSTTLKKAGRYRVCLAFRPAKDQSTVTPVMISHVDGKIELKIDQQKETTPFPFVSLGEFRFRKDSAAEVRITNKETDGFIAVDGVRWIWMGD